MMEQPQRMEVTSTTLYPRCLGNALKGMNQPMTIVGQIKTIDESDKSFEIEYDPDGKQTLRITVPSTYDIGDFKLIKFIEVRGVMSQESTINMKSYTDFKENFDLPAYNEMLKLATRQFRELFNY